jgi:hypothetical protein
MPDLIEQLQQYAAAAAETVRPVDLGRVREGVRRRRPSALAAAVAAVIAVVVVGASLAFLTRNEPSVEVTMDPPSTERPQVSPSTTVDQTTTTGPATRTLRTFPVVAFTGSEYLVWSGEAGENDTSQRADGFAVDVGTGEVRSIPVAPIDPRSGATGVWTGSDLIVCCGTGQLDGFGSDTRSAAAWDPATGEWRTLAQPPRSIARSYPTSIWTGELMVVVATGPAAATYDPATDRWTEITPPPSGGRLPESVWTGEDMIVWDSRYGSGSPGADDIADQGWTWRPGADAWTPLPALPSGRRIQLGSIAWTGSDLMVWGQSTSDEALGIGALWRPGTNEWRPVASSPQGPVPDPYNGTPGSQALASNADGRVLVKGLDGSSTATLYLYDPDSDTWTTTRLTVGGFHPLITFVDGTVLIPDSDKPIVGDLTP